jgi:outer membrane protein with beta-barrel domain
MLALAFVAVAAANARADFLITPFLGSAFAGSTTLYDLDVGAANSQHWTFGASVGWLSDQIFGVEADFAMIPGFFENDSGVQLVTSSRVTTLSGNVMAALPLSVTRESLRPYVIGGLGLLRATAEDQLNLNESSNLTALQLGGGVVGLVTNRAGVRFDLRHARALSRDITLRGEQTSKLSFWRFTVGVTLKY